MILFVDDEDRVDLFVDEMRQLGLEVEWHRNVDDAWRWLKEGANRPTVAVIDVMMPPGTLFANAPTDGGLRTGVALYRLLRKHDPACLVYLLTNNTSPEVAASIEGDDRAEVRLKDKTFYDEFADEVARRDAGSSAGGAT